MLRKCALHALLLCAVLIVSCEKENNIDPDRSASSSAAPSNNENERIGDALTSTNIDNPASYKCMYIDNANQIIGNASKENSLITYAANKQINAFAFYGLRSVISSSSGYSKLGSFLSRCAQSGITNFVYVVVYYPGSINGSDTTYVRKYNNSRTSSSEKITGMNLEWEWWNGATTWATYLATLKTYYNWTRSVSPNLSNEIYFGWFKNPLNLESTMAREIVKYCDRIVLHDYRPSPDVAYMKSRMDYFGQAALDQGVTKKIVILFSAESSFMGPYYTSHSFNDAYQSIVSQYTSTSFTGKAGLRIYGWQIFNYTNAKLYRP